MKGFVSVEKLRGPRAAVDLDPTAMQFTTKAAPAGGKKCKGCAFDGQWGRVCKIAADAAVRAGLEDCDSGYVYVLIETDPRQLAITGEST